MWIDFRVWARFSCSPWLTLRVWVCVWVCVSGTAGFSLGISMCFSFFIAWWLFNCTRLCCSCNNFSQHFLVNTARWRSLCGSVSVCLCLMSFLCFLITSILIVDFLTLRRVFCLFSGSQRHATRSVLTMCNSHLGYWLKTDFLLADNSGKKHRSIARSLGWLN